MSILFEPIKMANLEIKNRFIHSGTCESAATARGQVTDELVQRYRRLAQGEIGLIIPGYLYVHPLGRSMQYQTGIYDDELIPGLGRLVDAVHEQGGKIVFQLAHGGRQSQKKLIGQTPMGPSDRPRDPNLFFRPKKMTEEQIQVAIHAFGRAATRALEAGADGIQINGCHGYLVSQFLSPFFNDREDAWGGSDEKRFRFLRGVYLQIRKALPEGMPVLIKMNAYDHTPQVGVTPPLAAKYAGWLAELGIDMVEVSSGSVHFSPWHVCRGEVPVDEVAQSMSPWMRPVARAILKSQVGKYDLEEGYNLEFARAIRPAIGEMPLAAVGGLRRLSHMEEIVARGDADLISLCRPLIREPHLVKHFREGKTESAACESCNRCTAAMVNGMPVRCYCKGFPQ